MCLQKLHSFLPRINLLVMNDGRAYVFIRIKRYLLAANLLFRIEYLMVRGGIKNNDRGDLVILLNGSISAQKYISEVLDDYLLEWSALAVLT